MSKLYDEMHNLTQLSKTLRFELKPIGKTEKNFEKYILEKDEKKATAYPFVKKYCDEVHKNFINETLKQAETDKIEKELENYYSLVTQKEVDIDKLDEIKKSLRNYICKTFTDNDKYKDILGEKMISVFVKDIYKDDEEAMKYINEFDKFSTYFVGYHQSRANIYSNEEKHTAIAYRLIDENLPTFKNNLKLYADFAQVCQQQINNIKNELGIDTNDLFTDIKQYTKCLTQEDIEKYNLAITGKILENGHKIQGINEYINLYNQQNKDKKKLPKFKVLYKQILSDTDTESFVLDVIENDKQVINTVKYIYEQITETIKANELKKVFHNIEAYDREKIYINNDSITSFSKSVYGDWSYITRLLEANYDKNYNGKAKVGTEKYDENRDKELKKIKQISLNFIEQNAEEKGKIAGYFSKTIELLISAINNANKDFQSLSEKEYTNSSKDLQNDKESVERIKNLLDSIKELQNFVKILIPKTEAETDLNFYNLLNYEILSEIIPVYNKIRNYMTKKPYSEEKFKLNFDCPTLLGGWDMNKEESNLSILFEKDGLYYLGIMNKKDNKIFRDVKNGKTNYKKMNYKFFKDITTMIPKCSTQLNVVKNHFQKNDDDYILFDNKTFIKPLPISKEIFELNNKKYNDYKKFQIEYYRKTGDEIGYKKALQQWIDFCLNFLETYKSTAIYDLASFRHKKYVSLDKFYAEINLKLYKITFQEVSADYIDELVESGKLYLFQIYNKDFSEHSKGKPNLHTMYWKALFDEENLANVVYKLNGEAEIFYRKKSITKNIVTHNANEPINNKNPLNQKKTSTFKYDIIKDKRYTLDKFMFHVPITLNFKAKGITKFNDYTNNQIRQADDVHIIGIDRGERNLLYVSVIDMQGNIKEQFSLNEIINEYKGITHKVDYHSLLEKKEKERDEQRKNWGTIENIKELKEGYMSQVVHKLVNLMLEYNGIIVLEDLNSGMKNSRKKVEKQVYDKFETMMVNKLAYLVNKDVTDKTAQGGILNAYQLATADLKNVKQNGFIFYIPAWNTSKIDPTTGFVNLFRLQDYTSEEKCRQFVEKIRDIRFNSKENYFEFDIHYPDFTGKDCGTRKDWTLCTYGTRIRTFRDEKAENHWNNEDIDLTEEFKKLFAKYQINLSAIKTDILNKTDSKFFKSEGKDGYFGFMYLFKLMLQMRNSKTGSTKSEDDYIISPVKNAKGFFYDSRKNIKNLPKDADANGAYNIARKGLMLINRIKETTEDKAKIDYVITNSEYLNYVQSQDNQ